MLFKTSQVAGREHAAEPHWFAIAVLTASAAFLPIPEMAFTLPKLLAFAAVGFLGLLWVLITGRGGVLSLLLQRIPGIVILLFFVAVIVGTFRSVAPVTSLFGASPRLEGLMTFAVYASLFCIALCLAQDRAGGNALLHAFIASNTLLVAYGFLQFFGADLLAPLWADQNFLGRTFSLAGQPNALAAFILLTLPLVLHFAAASTHAEERRFLLILSAMNFVVLLTTSSRSGAIGIGVLLVCLGIYDDAIRKKVLRCSTTAKWMLAIGGVVLLLFGSLSFGQRFLREPASRSSSARMVIWNDAVNVLRDHPLGIGPDTLGLVYPRYKSAELLALEPLSAGVDRAHNFPLDLLLAVGPIGAAAYLAAVLLLLLQAVRARKKTPLLVVLGSALLAVHVAMFFSFQSILTAALTWLLMGWILGLLWKKDAATQKVSWAGMTAIGALSITCILTVLVCIQWTAQRTTLQQAEAAFAQGDIGRAVDRYVYAVRTFPFDRAVLVRSSETYLLSAESVPAGPARDGLLSMADAELARLQHLSGGQDGMAVLLGVWRAALTPDAAELKRLAAIARRRMPTTVDTYRILAHSYGLIGDTANARLAEQDLVTLLPQHWEDREGVARILWKENPWLIDFLD
jgi:O-antigen ligase